MVISNEIVEKAERARFEHHAYSAEAVASRRRGDEYDGELTNNAMRAALEAVAPAIRAAAMEEAAKIAEEHSWSRDIDWWRNATKKSVSAETALECAAAIRAAKETA